MDDELLDTPEAAAALEKIKNSQRAQKDAIFKVKAAEEDYIECITKIAAKREVVCFVENKGGPCYNVYD